MITFELDSKFHKVLALKYLKVKLEVLIDELESNSIDKNVISKYFLPIVFVEKKEKCIETIYKLKIWLEDNYAHEIGSLEKYVICKLFDEIEEEVDTFGIDEFCMIFFDESKESLLNRIKETFKDEILHLEIDEEINSDEYIFNFYVLGDAFISYLFEDIDETFVDLFTSGSDYSLSFIDPYFYDIMPEDIVKRALESKGKNNIKLYSFIDSFKEIIEKSYYRIKGFELYKEKDYQLLFELYAKAYNCCSLEFDKVYRENHIGDGNTDFIVTFPHIGNVLFELKIDRKENIVHAITKQVPEYLNRLKEKIAVVLIFSKNNSIAKYMELTKSIYKEYNLSIIPVIINITKKEVPSKISWYYKFVVLYHVSCSFCLNLYLTGKI